MITEETVSPVFTEFFKNTNQELLEAEVCLSGLALTWCLVRAPHLLNDLISSQTSGHFFFFFLMNELLENTKQKL